MNKEMKTIALNVVRDSVKEEFAGREKSIPINLKALEEGRKAA